MARAQVRGEVGGLRVRVQAARVRHHVRRARRRTARRLPAGRGLAVDRGAVAGRARRSRRRAVGATRRGVRRAPRPSPYSSRASARRRAASRAARGRSCRRRRRGSAWSGSCGAVTSPAASAAGQKRLPGRAKPTPASAEYTLGFRPTTSSRMPGPTVSGSVRRARRLDVDPLLAVVDELVDRRSPRPRRRRAGARPATT